VDVHVLGNPGFYYARTSSGKRESGTGIPWPHDGLRVFGFAEERMESGSQALQAALECV
jgi:hypothetical protein